MTSQAKVQAIALGTAAGLVAGAFTGGVLHLATPTAEERAAVAAPPEDFPNARLQYLPGVTVAGVRSQAQKAGLTCKKAPASEPAEHEVTCIRADGSLSVSVSYDDEARVRALTSECEPDPRVAADACTSLLAKLGAYGFPPDSDAAAEAPRWVKTHVHTDSSTEIADVRLTTSLEPRRVKAVPAGS